MELKECTAEGLCRLAEEYKLVIWGAGGTLDDMLNNFREYHFEKRITYIVDSNPKKWNTYKVHEGVKIPIGRTSDLLQLVDEHTLIIVASIFHKEICETLEDMGICKNCYKYPKLRYEFVLDVRNGMYDLPVEDNLIVFRSSLDYSDNARVLFDYMIKNGLNKKYKIVWMVANLEGFVWLSKYENVDVCACTVSNFETREEAIRYYRYKYSAKYFFVSHSLSWLHDRKENQIVFNLWHGNGYKRSKVGKSHRDSFEYTCVTGPLYSKYQTEFFDCDESKAVITGHPKTDLFFTSDIKRIKNIFGLEGYRKVIVWMPTFRNSTVKCLDECTIKCETGIPVLRTFEQLDSLNEVLQEQNIILIIKLHQYQETSAYTHQMYSNIKIWDSTVLVDEDIQPNEFLACADALLSDYSSTAVDFLSTDRMMGFAIDDYEEYTKGRLFLFEPLEDYLPGYIIKEYEELVAFISDLASDIDLSRDKRQKLMPQMMKYRDGKSCQRILEFLGI